MLWWRVGTRRASLAVCTLIFCVESGAPTVLPCGHQRGSGSGKRCPDPPNVPPPSASSRDQPMSMSHGPAGRGESVDDAVGTSIRIGATRVERQAPSSLCERITNWQGSSTTIPHGGTFCAQTSTYHQSATTSRRRRNVRSTTRSCKAYAVTSNSNCAVWCRRRVVNGARLVCDSAWEEHRTDNASAPNGGTTTPLTQCSAATNVTCTLSAPSLLCSCVLPTLAPIEVPTRAPTHPPSTRGPTSLSRPPTVTPTDAVTTPPSTAPSTAPSTDQPTGSPMTATPTVVPTVLSAAPTIEPTDMPTAVLSAPSDIPTRAPTALPTLQPSSSPTGTPTLFPTLVPTRAPSTSPTVPLSDSPAQAHVTAPRSSTAAPSQSPAIGGPATTGSGSSSGASGGAVVGAVVAVVVLGALIGIVVVRKKSKEQSVDLASSGVASSTNPAFRKSSSTSSIVYERKVNGLPAKAAGSEPGGAAAKTTQARRSKSVGFTTVYTKGSTNPSANGQHQDGMAKPGEAHGGVSVSFAEAYVNVVKQEAKGVTLPSAHESGARRGTRQEPSPPPLSTKMSKPTASSTAGTCKWPAAVTKWAAAKVNRAVAERALLGGGYASGAFCFRWGTTNELILVALRANGKPAHFRVAAAGPGRIKVADVKFGGEQTFSNLHRLVAHYSTHRLSAGIERLTGCIPPPSDVQTGLRDVYPIVLRRKPPPASKTPAPKPAPGLQPTPDPTDTIYSSVVHTDAPRSAKGTPPDSNDVIYSSLAHDSIGNTKIPSGDSNDTIYSSVVHSGTPKHVGVGAANTNVDDTLYDAVSVGNAGDSAA